jgi:branched-chain amino acid transport system ATP-binding protein
MMAMSDSIILETKNLTKRFGGLVAVNNVSFQMTKRTIHSLIGPNGSGKTTTINVIDGVYKSDGGSYYFDGEDVTGIQTDQLTLKGVGRTFQNIKLFNSMSVTDNLLVGADAAFGSRGILHYLLTPGKYAAIEKQVIEKAREIMDFLGIYHLKDEIVSNLSYGRQKATELGRTLMSNPRLILLDEPAAGLNPTERGVFVDILQKTFDSGVDLFLIEHNMDVVMNISDTVTVLNFGSKIAEGTPTEVQNDVECIKAYLGERYKVIEKGRAI